MLIFYLQLSPRKNLFHDDTECYRHKKDFDHLRIIWKLLLAFIWYLPYHGRFALLNTSAFLRELSRDPKWFKTPVMHFPSQLHSLIFTGFVRASAVALCRLTDQILSIRFDRTSITHTGSRSRRQIRNPVVNFTCQGTPARNWSLHGRDEFSSHSQIQFISTRPFN